MGSGINRQGAESERLDVRLLGGLRVARGEDRVPLSGDGRRLVAFLALERGWVPRSFVAGALWLDVTQERAYGSLRSALWRVRSQDEGVVLADGDMVSLCPDAVVDVETAGDIASLLFSDGSTRACEPSWIDLFSRELLPGWYDDFVVIERESLRQQALHALEAIAASLTAEQQFPEAMRAALAAVRLDRLRESAHRAVMCIHIAEGNYSEARRQYEEYADLVEAEFGLAPSPTIDELVCALPVASSSPRGLRPGGEPAHTSRRARRATGAFPRPLR